jgi:oxygen-independent coproporphyrinogen-3 oxidase
VRWWNVKHPAAYAERLGRGVSPALAREVLGYHDQRVERILLEIRLVEGLPVTALEATGRSHVARLVADGLVELVAERLVLTQRGRLLADAIVRDLVD